MKPKPLSSENHLTVPVAMLFLHGLCAAYAEAAEKQRPAGTRTSLPSSRPGLAARTLAPLPSGWAASVGFRPPERRAPLGEVAVRRERRARLGEGHEPPAVGVPELESRGAQPVPQGERRDVVENRILVVRALEVVVRDLRGQVVHVVEPDVAREELERLRQAEVRASAQGGVGVAPALRALPVGVLKLVL